MDYKSDRVIPYGAYLENKKKMINKDEISEKINYLKQQIKDLEKLIV